MTIDHTLSALYFPATRIPGAAAARLLLPLDKLFAYQPAEGPQTQSLTATRLVEAYPPAPLGDELDRFRRLLKDMQNHATEYHQAYLSSLAAGAEEDAEAGWRQVARQLKQAAPPPETTGDDLWQARLYLALAENHAALQEDLATGIEAVSRRETELLRQLQGEEEELAELPLSAAAPAASLPRRGEQLLAAWGLLYLADTRPDRPWLLATDQEESARLLFEEYERAAGRRPEELLSLALPPLTGAGENFPEERRAVREAVQDLPERLGAFLAETAFADSAAAGPGETAAEIAGAWQESVAARIKKPAAEADASGPARFAALTFYRLPGISFPRLFSLFCSREEKEATGPSSPNGVLAVIRDSE